MVKTGAGVTSLSSNQTVAGLKYLLIRWKDNVVLGSNQTVAGLKSTQRELCGTDGVGSNQTVAGLKF